MTWFASEASSKVTKWPLASCSATSRNVQLITLSRVSGTNIGTQSKFLD